VRTLWGFLLKGGGGAPILPSSPMTCLYRSRAEGRREAGTGVRGGFPSCDAFR
jgi:hypothetical protein